STIRVMVRDKDDGSVEYRFYEVARDAITRETRTECCAKVEIESHSPTARESHLKGFTVKELTAHSSDVIRRDEFYRALRANGNQYGPEFQRLDGVWRSGDHVLGRLSVPRGKGQARRDYLLP